MSRAWDGAISFQEPGDISVSGSGVAIWDAPHYFGAAHGLSCSNISLNADAGVRNAI